MPDGSALRNFSPFIAINTPKTPNLSPIIKPKTPASESAFLKRRDYKWVDLLNVTGSFSDDDFYYRSVQEKFDSKYRRRTCFDVPVKLNSSINLILDQTISVKSTLKALKLEHLQQIFDKEEINTMLIFFTLSNEDLVLIGVADDAERKKILDFIASFKTPTKTNVSRFRT